MIVSTFLLLLLYMTFNPILLIQSLSLSVSPSFAVSNTHTQNKLKVFSSCALAWEFRWINFLLVHFDAVLLLSLFPPVRFLPRPSSARPYSRLWL
jgi:hypothetical protein